MASASWATCVWFQRFSRAMILVSSPSVCAEVWGSVRDRSRRIRMKGCGIGRSSLRVQGWNICAGRDYRNYVGIPGAMYGRVGEKVDRGERPHGGCSVAGAEEKPQAKGGPELQVFQRGGRSERECAESVRLIRRSTG